MCSMLNVSRDTGLNSKIINRESIKLRNFASAGRVMLADHRQPESFARETNERGASALFRKPRILIGRRVTRYQYLFNAANTRGRLKLVYAANESLLPSNRAQPERTHKMNASFPFALYAPHARTHFKMIDNSFRRIETDLSCNERRRYATNFIYVALENHN